MTTTALNYLKVRKSVRAKVSDIFFPKISWKLVCFIAFFMCLSLLIYYVWQVVHLTSGSYYIENYKKQITQLLNEKKDLEISFAENSFLGQAQQKIRELNFQKTTLVRYIQIPDNAVARAK